MAIIRGRKRRGGVEGDLSCVLNLLVQQRGKGASLTACSNPGFYRRFFFWLGKQKCVLSPPNKKNENGFSTLVINLLFSPQTEIHFSGSSDPNLGRSNIGRRRRKRYSRGIKRERENISSSDCPEKKDRNFLSQASWFPSSLFLKVFYFL